jgi:hypothetical protein
MEDEDVRFERLRRLKLEDEEKKMKRQEAHEQKEKLPKLEITKFDSTIIDWVRFWEQFNEEIDKCKYYAPITKFFLPTRTFNSTTQNRNSWFTLQTMDTEALNNCYIRNMGRYPKSYMRMVNK